MVPSARPLLQKLGPRWSARELATFYDGFRQCQRNFVQIALLLEGRTLEMVESLFQVHQNYLLSEGSTREGFVEVMNDLYQLFSEPATPEKKSATPSKGVKRSAKKRRLVDETPPEVPVVVRNSALSTRKHCPESYFGNPPRFYPGSGGLDANGRRCLHSLTTQQRLFNVYEWFYNDLDRLFFLTNEFPDAISRIGVMSMPQPLAMTRRAWSTLRVLIGKPRRLSPFYFRQEMDNYHSFRRQYFPTIQNQLHPGKRVIALHPIHKYQASGVVLNYDHSMGGHAGDLIRVQFDRTEDGIYYCPPSKVMSCAPEKDDSFLQFQHFVYQVIDILLERKQLLLRDLQRINRSVGRLDGTYPKDVQLKVAWLLTNIRQTEEALKQVVAESSVDLRGDKEMSELDEFCDSCERASCLLIATRANSLSSTPNQHHSDLLELAKEIENTRDAGTSSYFRLLVNSISLLMAIRNCSDKYVEKEKIIMFLDSFMERLKPQFKSNEEIYGSIRSLLDSIKGYCVPRMQ